MGWLDDLFGGGEQSGRKLTDQQMRDAKRINRRSLEKTLREQRELESRGYKYNRRTGKFDPPGSGGGWF